MFSQYNLTKAPGNWRKLPMVKILEELIVQRIQWYEDLKKTWIGMLGVQYVGIEDMDDFERDEIMHLRWQMLRRLEVEKLDPAWNFRRENKNLLYEPSAAEVEHWRKQQTDHFGDVSDESSDENEQEEVQEHDSDNESMCSSIEISRGSSMMPVNHCKLQNLHLRRRRGKQLYSGGSH